MYVQIRDLPLLGIVRVGHFKECFGLEQLTSDNYTTFMERSLDDEGTFVPGRNDGIMAYNWNECQTATWAAGVFTNQTGYDQPPTFQYDHWGLDFAARATYLPWYDEASEGRGLIHTGIDYAYRTAPDAVGQTFAIRPECNFAPAVVNLTLLDVNRWQEMDGEAGDGLWAAVLPIGGLRRQHRTPNRRQHQLLRHLCLRQLLPHRREPPL